MEIVKLFGYCLEMYTIYKLLYVVIWISFGNGYDLGPFMEIPSDNWLSFGNGYDLELFMEIVKLLDIFWKWIGFRNTYGNLVIGDVTSCFFLTSHFLTFFLAISCFVVIALSNIWMDFHRFLSVNISTPPRFFAFRYRHQYRNVSLFRPGQPTRRPR